MEFRAMDNLSTSGRRPAQPASEIYNAETHNAEIHDQFGRQAKLFAKSRGLHNSGVLSLLVDAAEPKVTDTVLDVACGPGSVVAAFAARVRRAVGLDTTDAMLDQARTLAKERNLANVAWHLGDVYELPFSDASFDIVTCRFAFHHLQRPLVALEEMKRVCNPGGRIVVCDGVAADDPAKAAAFNRMERHRDPSTVEFRPLSVMLGMFAAAALPPPSITPFQVPTEREALIEGSFPVGDDRAALRKMIDQSIDGDTMGLGAHRDGGTVRFSYPSVILVSSKAYAHDNE
jgi:SAM-dependent methyltransferase